MTNKKNNKKAPKINQYWFYGGIIFLFILLQLFSGGVSSSDANQTTPSKFFEYVSMGDVERIEIINKREVKVYLTEEASSKDIHKETIKAYFPLSARKASYKFEFGDLQNFENRLKRNEEENNLVIEVNYVTEQNIWGDLLLSMLPFVLIIGVFTSVFSSKSLAFDLPILNICPPPPEPPDDILRITKIQTPIIKTNGSIDNNKSPQMFCSVT